MGSVKQQFDRTFRDYVTDGVATSGLQDVSKADARQCGSVIEAAMGNIGLSAMVGKIAVTRAVLDADLAHDEGVTALVYGDATDANNDLYTKVGASGAGSWTLTTFFHDVLDALVGTATNNLNLVLAGFGISFDSGTETIGQTFVDTTSTGSVGSVRMAASAFAHRTVLKRVRWTPRTTGSGGQGVLYRPNASGTYDPVATIDLGTVTAPQINLEQEVDVSSLNIEVEAGWIGGHYTATGGRVMIKAEPARVYTGALTDEGVSFTVRNQAPSIQFIGDYAETLGEGAVLSALTDLQARASDLEAAEPAGAIWWNTRANTTRLLNGIIDVLNGVRDFEILVVGDSLVAGSWSGIGGTSLYNSAFLYCFPAMLAAALKALGVPVSYQSIWGCHNTQVAYGTYNPAVTLGSDWVYGGQAFGLAISAPAWTTLGGALFISPTGGANEICSWQMPDPADHVLIGVPKRADAGTLQLRFDGGAWHDIVQTSATEDYTEITFTSADDAALATVARHKVEWRRKDDTGWGGFARLDAWNSTRPSVRIHNAGHAGALATTTLMTQPSPWSPLPRLIAQTCGMVIYNPATNDCRDGKSPSELATAQALHLGYFKERGSDVIMVSMAPQDPNQAGSYATLEQQAAFAATTKAVAQAGGAVMVDLIAVFRSWALANAAGRYGDYIHLNRSGYQIYANELLQIIAPIVREALAILANAPGTWIKLPSIYKLIVAGAGMISIDTISIDGMITLAAKIIPVTGADIIIHNFGTKIDAVRASTTGSATMEIR